MNIVLRACMLVAALALAACSQMPKSIAQGGATESASSRVPGEYVVTLEAGERESAVTERFGRLGIKRMLPLGSGVFLLNIGNDPGPREMEALIKPDKRFKSVQPNLIFRADGAGNGVKN